MEILVQYTIFLIQNLAHKTDSVGYDCIFQYKILENQNSNVIIFADIYDKEIHRGINIQPFKDFYKFHKKNLNSKIIYHFCDGWNELDEYLIENPKNVYIRWHNNTPPWFYYSDYKDFAMGGLRGFKILSRMTKSTLKFLVNSDFTKRQLESLGGYSDNIFSVYPGSSFLNKEKINLNKEKIYGKKSIDILFVSRVVPHKGHKHIITIADIIKKFLKINVNFHVVGSTEGRMKKYSNFLLVESSKRDINIKFHGLISEEKLYSTYKNSDIFMCMSEHEGFGMPAFEAMRCGIPIITWANTAFSDLLINHPFSNENYDPYWFAAAAIFSVTSDEYSSEISNIQNEILETYNKNIVKNQLTNAFLNKNYNIKSKKSHSYEQIKEKIHQIEKIIKKELKNIEIYDFDSSKNYFSLYDVGVFDNLLEQKKSYNNIPVSDNYEFNSLNNLIKSVKSNSVNAIKNNAEELFKLDDEVFVKALFLLNENKQIDIKYIKYFTYKLRNGCGKQKILEEFILMFDMKNDIDINRIVSNENTIENIEYNIRRIEKIILNDFSRDPSRSEPLNEIHIDDLLYYPDEEFVRYSFELIVGRRAEESAVSYYVKKLCHDLDRVNFIKDLYLSDEAKKFSFKKVVGIEKLFFNESDNISERINIIENKIGRIINSISDSNMPLSLAGSNNKNNIHFPELESFFQEIKTNGDFFKVKNVKELLKLPSDEFICASYKKVLGRSIDDDGLSFYKDKMNKGFNKVKILLDLASSDEAKSYGIHLSELDKFIKNPIKYDSLYFSSIKEITGRDDDFLDCCFINFLGRDIDDDSRLFFEKEYEKNNKDKDYIINMIKSSEEGVKYNRSIV